MICKRILKHVAKLAKWLICVVRTYLNGAFDCVLLSCRIHVSVTLHFAVVWMSRNWLLKTGVIYENQTAATAFKPTMTYFVNEHWTIQPNWLNEWAVLWDLICMVYRLCVFTVSRTGFRVILHYVVSWISRNYLLKTGIIPEF